VTCQTCGRILPGDDGVEFCPYCGAPVQGLAGVVNGGPSLSCPGCGTQNMANARFCKSCGRQLPSGWGYAAQAAGDAQKTMPTSSSGRQPMSYAERCDYLRRTGNQQAERAAVAVPAPTGDSLKDLANAEEHFTRVDTLWEELDTELKQARSAAGLIPTAADAAEIRDLERRTDIAFASRQAAKAHRDALWDEEHAGLAAIEQARFAARQGDWQFRER
jgi:predicted RNA-binding Zn-ribbon protein involved in translation (DUF1610 family)